jgi:predicted nucleic acid-binding protein
VGGAISGHTGFTVGLSLIVYGETWIVDIIVDTQILSYRFKGIEQDVHDRNLAISSITASEFLIAQSRDSEKPDYYIIHPSRYPNLVCGDTAYKHFGNPRNAKMSARRTDQVIIDFGSHFSAYREFGNEAISQVINENKLDAYKVSISHLPKQKQKYLMRRLMYLVDTGYYCYPLTESILDKALSLFLEFTSEYNCKNNVRNTVNDILILATAIDREKKLLTHDSLLSRFAAKYYEVPLCRDKEETLIDFSKIQVQNSKNSESKGYINKGWSYAMRNRQSF